MIGPWLKAFTHQLVAKVMTLESLQNLESVNSFRVSYEDYYFPWDSIEFTSKVTENDGFQWQLWTPVFDAFGVDCNVIPSSFVPQNKFKFESTDKKFTFRQKLEDIVGELSQFCRMIIEFESSNHI